MNIFPTIKCSIKILFLTSEKCSLPYGNTIMCSTVSFLMGLSDFSCLLFLLPFIIKKVHMYLNICHTLHSSLHLIPYICPITESCCLKASLLALCLFLLHTYYQCSNPGPPTSLFWIDATASSLGPLKSTQAHPYPFNTSRKSNLSNTPVGPAFKPFSGLP